VEEQTIPWWRKALKFALGGIRSGFGLFPRPAKAEAVREEKITENSEESLEIETALTKPSPEHEAFAAEPVIQPEPEADPAPVATPGPAIEPVLSPNLPSHPADPISAVPEPENPEAADPIEEIEVVDEAFSETVEEAEVQPEAVSVAISEPEPEVEKEPVSEPKQEAQAEPEAVSEPAPDLIEVIEPVLEDAPTDETVPKPYQVAEAEVETALTPEVTVDSDPEPETIAEVKFAESEALDEPETEVKSEPISESLEESEVEPDANPEVAETLEIGSEPEAVIEVASETVEAAEPVEEMVIVNEVVEELPEEIDAEAETTTTPDALVAFEPAPQSVAEDEFVEREVFDEPESEVESESVFDPVDESPVEPESVSEPEPEPVAESDIEVEAVPEPVEEVKAKVIAAPAPIEVAVTVEEAEIKNSAVPEMVEEAENEVNIATTPETDVDAESAPGAPAEAVSAEREAPAESGTPHLVLTPEPTVEEAASEKADEKAAAKLAARQKKLDEGSEQSPFSVLVGQVYDGPLDLLLDLIRKQDIDIYDIPIAKITAQFLAYVNQLKSSDVDVAGEFIYTASLLIHIKSKMLLPRSAAEGEDTSEDPRRELVERLLEHERFKNAAQMLQQKQMLEAATWSNPGASEFKGDAGAEPEIAADTVDLVRIFRDILERARKRPAFNVEEDSVTVGQMIQFLARRLTMEDKPIALRKLLSHTRSERALIAMFLALLELVRMQAILLRQDRAFSEIFVKKHTGFDTVMSEGLMNTHDDWR
jgi:segregation and condensation protein A